MSTTPELDFYIHAMHLRDSLRIHIEKLAEEIFDESKTENSREFLRLTQNYLAVGGRFEDIKNFTDENDFEKLTHLLKSEFDKHPTRDPNLEEQTVEMFYANFYKKFKCVAIESSDKANFLEIACGLIDMFIQINETMGKRPEFVFPGITENSVLKYYVHLSLKLLNDEERTIFQECYYESQEVSKLKDKLVRFVHQEAKQRVESVLRLTEKYEPGIEKMLKSVAQLMMIKGPKTYKEILHKISTDVDWNLSENPGESFIIELQNYLKNGRMEDSAVRTSLYSIVTQFESRKDKFETEFDDISIIANTLLLELCETEYRNVVLGKLKETLMQSKTFSDEAKETLKEVYQNFQMKDATKSFGDDLEKLTKSMMKYHKEKTYAKYLMEYY